MSDLAGPVATRATVPQAAARAEAVRFRGRGFRPKHRRWVGVVVFALERVTRIGGTEDQKG